MRHAGYGEIRVVSQDPAWTGMFGAEAAALSSVLGEEALAIHHMGSTAILGIKAKPIVDILIEVREIEKVDNFNPEVSGLGYEAHGEFGLLGRRYFTKNRGPIRTHNAHIYQRGNPEIERHLAFRDYMISHAEDARAYSRLKEELAEKFPADIYGYMDGKDAFAKEMEMKALTWNRSRS